MSTHHIPCPCCGHPVTVTLEDGEPGIYGHGDNSRDQAPTGDTVDEVDGCECRLYLEAVPDKIGAKLLDAYDRRVVEACG